MKKLLKIIIIIVLAVVIVIGAALVVNSVYGTEPAGFGLKTASAAIAAVDVDASDAELTEYAQEILFAISSEDYAALSSVAHAEFGVVFSPYATVNLTTDCCFTASQIADFGDDTAKYIWGVYDGSAEPIEMTPAEYFDTFVFDTDFTKCEEFGVDEILRSGNSLENITEVFPECRFVDCYMPDSTGEEGVNWQSLRLVFEEYKGKLMLTAIVHSEYTI